MRAIIYIILAGVLWGTSSIFFNVLKPYGFTPMEMTAMRGLVSAIAFPLYTLFTDKSVFKVTLKELAAFAGNGLAVYGTASLYFMSIEKASVSTAVILMYTAPVIVMVYSVAFLGEKLSRVKALSVAMVVIGCALVSGIVGGLSGSFVGIMLGLGSGIAYSMYNIFTKIEMLKGYNPNSATMYGFIVMGLFSLLFVSPMDMAQKATVNPVVTIPVMIGIGVFTCLFPYLLYTTALCTVPAGTASSLAIIEPLSATIFSVVLFGEKLSAPSVIGIALILVAVYLLGKGEGKEV